MAPYNFIKLFQNVYSIVSSSVLANVVYKCFCRQHVTQALTELENILSDLQGLPDLVGNSENKWIEVVSKTRRQLSNFCDDSRDILFHCRHKTKLSSSETLDLHILTYVTTVLSLEIIWKDLVLNCKNIHPTKSNTEILSESKISLLLFANFNDDILTMIQEYPQHFLTMVLTWSDKPDELDTMCKKSLKFLRNVGSDALSTEDRNNIGQIIRSQITVPKYVEGGDAEWYCGSGDIDSEDMWTNQESTEESSSSDSEEQHDFYYSFVTK